MFYLDKVVYILSVFEPATSRTWSEHSTTVPSNPLRVSSRRVFEVGEVSVVLTVSTTCRVYVAEGRLRLPDVRG